MKISRLLTATALVSAGFAVPQYALAQDSTAQDSTAQVAEGQAEGAGEEVTVVGSRIRRNPTNSPTPLIQIGQEELLQSGEVNVIDFLADM